MIVDVVCLIIAVMCVMVGVVVFDLCLCLLIVIFFLCIDSGERVFVWLEALLCVCECELGMIVVVDCVECEFMLRDEVIFT